jgi:membrane-bound serine protease (ClpP class)
MLRFVPSLCVFSALVLASASEQPAVDADEVRARPLVLVATLENEPITPGASRYLERSIREAESRQAECLIIVLDTPGGLLESTRTIVKEILGSRTCVVVYVAPSSARAASAGVFITLASHVAAMAPGTRIGAAHPVNIGELPIQLPTPESPEGEDSKETPPKEESPLPLTTMGEKLVKDTVALARSLAGLRNRNADWAARAVEESDVLLSSKAVQEGVVDFEAENLDDLLEKLDGREVSLLGGPRTLETSQARVEPIPMWWGERVLALLSQPNVAFLLLLAGMAGLLFEFHSPGWGVPGTAGVICLLLAFFGLSLLPVNYLGLVLILVAILLFAAEVFVTSFGALTIGGIVCLVLGGVMLVDSPAGFARVSLGVVLPVAAATAFIVLLLVGGIVRAHRRRPKTGDEALIGTTVEVQRDFSPRAGRYEGTVFVHGEWWKATSDAPVAAGQQCTVDRRQGLTLVVKPS